MVVIGYGFYLRLSVCLSVFPRDISKTDAAGSSSLTQKCFMMCPGNSFNLRSKGQRSRSRVTQTLPAWVFATTQCWLLLVAAALNKDLMAFSHQCCLSASVAVAVSCPDVTAPAGGQVRRTDVNTTIVTCINSDEVWYLTCRGVTWAGKYGNCSHG